MGSADPKPDLPELLRQTACVLAYATETHLATLERLEMRRSVSKSDLSRQTSICTTLVGQCFDLGIEPKGLRGQTCVRLEERLDALKAATKRRV